MKRFFAFVALLVAAIILAAALTNAQTSPQATGSTISGTVVSDPGSHPLKKVLVQVVAMDPERQVATYSAITEGDGHFVIENVAPSLYGLFLEKTGFVEVNSRGHKSDMNMITVKTSQPVDGLMFHMLSTAVISGRITDEDGDPMPEVRVAAQRKVPGKSGREIAGMASTNDLGEFRLTGLFPSQYWVIAIPAPDFRDYSHPAAGQKQTDSQEQPETRYVTTYYPGTYDRDQASPIAIKAGDEMPVNMTLAPTRTYHIRGTIAGLPAGEKAEVDLVSKLGDAIRASEVGTDGSFEVRGAAPGAYTIRANAGSDQSTVTAASEVTVVAADVEGIRLVPGPSFPISGHVSFDRQSDTDWAQYTVNLRKSVQPEESGLFMSQDAMGENATVDRQGNFSFQNISAGAYVLQVYGGNGKTNYYLEAARLGGRNIEGGFTVSGPASLDLVLSAKSATIEGNVSDHDAQGNDVAVPTATVVAVPDEKLRNVPSRYGVGVSDQHGHYIIRGLAPGNYTLFAWQDMEHDLYLDSDFIKSQESNGIALKVEESSHPRLDLRLSPIGDDWR